MNDTTTTNANDQASRLYGYDVYDNAGNKLGSVDGVWVDDATGDLEFASIKTGWLFGKTHLIPLEDANIDSGNNSITVPYSEDQVKNAPSFDTDAELSPQDEDTIYSYYGMQRDTTASPTGLGEDTGTQSTVGTTTTGYTETETTGYTGTQTTGDTTNLPTPPTDINVPITEEQLAVGKRAVEAGRVRLRKVVTTEHVEEPVELRREEVHIERVSASDATVPDNAFQEGEIDVPVMREEPVVAKQAQVVGQVHVGKDVETDTQTIEGEVRREDVEVDRSSVSDEFIEDDTTTDTTTRRPLS